MKTVENNSSLIDENILQEKLKKVSNHIIGKLLDKFYSWLYSSEAETRKVLVEVKMLNATEDKKDPSKKCAIVEANRTGFEQFRVKT